MAAPPVRKRRGRAAKPAAPCCRPAASNRRQCPGSAPCARRTSFGLHCSLVQPACGGVGGDFVDCICKERIVQGGRHRLRVLVRGRITYDRGGRRTVERFCEPRLGHRCARRRDRHSLDPRVRRRCSNWSYTVKPQRTVRRLEYTLYSLGHRRDGDRQCLPGRDTRVPALYVYSRTRPGPPPAATPPPPTIDNRAARSPLPWSHGTGGHCAAPAGPDVAGMEVNHRDARALNGRARGVRRSGQPARRPGRLRRQLRRSVESEEFNGHGCARHRRYVPGRVPAHRVGARTCGARGRT